MADEVEPVAWTPAFPGQRPPFGKGHEINLRHGAHRNSRRVDERAREVLERERSKPAWPAYLNDGSMETTLRSWSRAVAICELLEEYASGKDIADALSDVITTEDNEYHYEGGQTNRKSVTRREGNVMEALVKWSTIASNHAHRMGLDPLGRARLGKDISQTTNPDLARYWQHEGDQEVDGHQPGTA